MDSRNNEEHNISDVVDNLMNMFGKVMSKDVISAVVESCDGDCEYLKSIVCTCVPST